MAAYTPVRDTEALETVHELDEHSVPLPPTRGMLKQCSVICLALENPTSAQGYLQLHHTLALLGCSLLGKAAAAAAAAVIGDILGAGPILYGL